MKNNQDLLNQLTRDINKLQNKIDHRRLYNLRNYVVRLLIKSGIVLDYALPFILTAIIIANAQASKGNAPFRIDEITENSKIETIDTSSGIHIEKVSYDYYYDEELIEYSTGWIINDNGLYERTVTSYRISDVIDLSDTKKVLSMSKEEIDNSLVITNIETIQKNTLDDEDNIYDSDAIIVINHSMSQDDFILRKETVGENILQSIFYIVLVFISGIGLTFLGKIFLKTRIKDNLKRYESAFKEIKDDDLDIMKKILQLKQENLLLLSDTENNELGEKNYSYKLRKDKR